MWINYPFLFLIKQYFVFAFSNDLLAYNDLPKSHFQHPQFTVPRPSPLANRNSNSKSIIALSSLECIFQQYSLVGK